MSRLDTFIERLQVQRRLLDWAVQEVADLDGIVIELGLGNGRTYDHLRERLPGRRIFAFDRRATAHPKSMPDSEALVLGELENTLPSFFAKHGASAILVHIDIKIGVPELERNPPPWLAGNVAALVRPRGIVISDFALTVPCLSPMRTKIQTDRYFTYRGVADSPFKSPDTIVAVQYPQPRLGHRRTTSTPAPARRFTPPRPR